MVSVNGTLTTNDAPTAADNTVTTAEDTAYTFTANDFGFVDADGDTLASVRIVTLPVAGNGTLELSGTAVVADEVVPEASIGNLAYIPPENANGTGYASFTFKVSDGTDESAVANTMTIDVTAGNDPATGEPTITGTAQVGRTLTADTTGILDEDGLTSPTYTYQWIRVDGTDDDIAGENSSTYTLVDADLGKTIKVRVSFDDDGGNTETLTSAATATVIAPNTAPTAANNTVTTAEDTAYTFTATDFGFVDTDGDTLASVKIETPPASGNGTLALSGTAVATDEVVPAASIGNLAYTPPENANGPGYASFTFKVSDGTDESAVANTMTIDVTAGNDPATGEPTITGTAQVGRTLTAVTTGITDADGLTSVTYTYQWIRVDGTEDDIAGENSSTYTLVDADLGKTIKVRVSFDDDGGNTETLTSAATGDGDRRPQHRADGGRQHGDDGPRHGVHLHRDGFRLRRRGHRRHAGEREDRDRADAGRAGARRHGGPGERRRHQGPNRRQQLHLHARGRRERRPLY